MSQLGRCPTCNRQISTNAGSCPYCGEKDSAIPNPPELPEKKDRRDDYPYRDTSRKSGESFTCFPAGTLVSMADGTEKAIEEVLIGDLVITPFGPSEVKEFDRPLLGARPLYEMQNGRKLRASAEHSIWGRDPETSKEWWTTRDIDLWREEAGLGVGSNYQPDPVNLKDQEGVEWEFATVEGWNKTSWKRVDASEELQLYDLVLDSGGAYFADGYLVKALYDTPTESWNRYNHTPIVTHSHS